VVFFLTALLVVAADQLSKIWIRSYPEGQPIFEAGFFRIIHIHNTGATFGLFRDQSFALTIVALVGVVVILLYARPLNIMQLDEEQAQQLGINVERLKLVLLAAATLITAAAVSFVGTIGFVGIIIPHAVRLIWGADHRFLLPLSVLTGAIFLILADLIARTVLAPTEIPVGVITALCGAPFFLYLLRRKRKIIF